MTLILASPTTQTSTRHTLLVIGYGNALRGDDAVGCEVAIAVADWHLLPIKSVAVQQLMPELAAEIAKADYVIFVDACSKSYAPTIQLDPIVVDKNALAYCAAPILMNHACNPSALVALTHVLYGRHPQTWLLQIPTEHCDLGRPLSKTAQRGMDLALRTIEQFLITYLQPVGAI